MWYELHHFSPTDQLVLSAMTLSVGALFSSLAARLYPIDLRQTTPPTLDSLYSLKSMSLFRPIDRGLEFSKVSGWDTKLKHFVKLHE
jgi:hypothetical protein